jgi:hypothetical protein
LCGQSVLLGEIAGAGRTDPKVSCRIGHAEVIRR